MIRMLARFARGAYHGVGMNAHPTTASECCGPGSVGWAFMPTRFARGIYRNARTTFALLLAFLTVTAHAAPAAYQPPAAPATASLLQTIFALTLVLALLLGLAWLAKRYGPRATGSSANLRIVGALNLGGRERILLVEVADQWIVVGAAPGRVNLLSTMPKQEGAEPPPGFAANAPAGFADWLKHTIEKRNAK
jgi:flagellar biosynthetic protein FliO